MARRSLVPFGSSQMSSIDPFVSLQRGMNRLFEDMFSTAGLPATGAEGQEGAVLMPQINVSETDKEIRITAELPGVAEKDVEVTLDDDVLTIRGEKRMEQKEDRENYHFVERSFGRFMRSLRLPQSVLRDQVRANVENGVLTVVLPKNAAQEKTRHIPVGGAGKGSGTSH
ncbi:Hsp20/alpha crystallin family protein [Kaistia adipata]|uniref:Hsp20/alpha crystallin family protein n=1 Tax=Kaistia adipata TaxID=166954 RepID=UPI0004085E38|nr:Hsp20/alpha crystallin family protein [Kaistia adipata]